MKKTILIIFACAMAQLAWAQSTMKLGVAECRSMALESSEDMKKAENDELQAQLTQKVAQNARLPRVSASANGMYMFPDLEMMGTTFAMPGAYTAGLVLTQPLYVGGKITSGIKLAKVGVEASKHKTELQRRDVIYNADNAYWTFVAVREQRKMLDGILTFVQAMRERVQLSVDAQLTTKADLLRVDSKLSDVKYQIERATNGLEMCRMNLCSVTGLPMNTAIEPIDTLPEVTAPQAWLYDSNQGESLTMSRPEYKLLEKQIEAADLQIKQIRADYLPTLAFTAGYAFFGNMKMTSMVADGMGGYFPYSTTINKNVGQLMLSLNIPILNWGESSKKIKAQRLVKQNAELDLQKNARLMNIELTNARQNVESAYTMFLTAKSGLAHAEEALRVMRDRYEVGMCTLTDILEAQSAYQQARTNVIEATTQFKIHESNYTRITTPK